MGHKIDTLIYILQNMSEKPSLINDIRRKDYNFSHSYRMLREFQDAISALIAHLRDLTGMCEFQTDSLEASNCKWVLFRKLEFRRRCFCASLRNLKASGHHTFLQKALSKRACICFPLPKHSLSGLDLHLR